ncbi:hypothetical protein EI94DRAFT_536424 [Lactarius quietus]|nr:hypothetical protein EI94DRAFT_536424 [Lactarius quietus]
MVEEQLEVSRGRLSVGRNEDCRCWAEGLLLRRLTGTGPVSASEDRRASTVSAQTGSGQCRKSGLHCQRSRVVRSVRLGTPDNEVTDRDNRSAGPDNDDIRRYPSHREATPSIFVPCVPTHRISVLRRDIPYLIIDHHRRSTVTRATLSYSIPPFKFRFRDPDRPTYGMWESLPTHTDNVGIAFHTAKQLYAL